MITAAIVLAAGKGSRMGADKALLDLGGMPAIARLCEQCLAAAMDVVFVVRARGALPLPTLTSSVRVIEVSGEGEMVDSLRAVLRALPPEVQTVVCLPVDHALVTADTIAAVAAMAQRDGVGIALPLFRGKTGHPVALRRSVLDEIADSAVDSLRSIVRRDPARVRAVPTSNPWVRADLDRPEDLRAARAALAAEPFCTVEQMHRHRSHRAYQPTPLAEGQIERLVDAARYASTSSFIQAYSVVVVRDPQHKAACAALCADQQHILAAPVFAAVCADVHKIAKACERAGQKAQTQSFELFLQATVDAALLGQNLQLAAESEGLGACMIGAARNHPVELAQLLQLPEHVYVVFGMTLGHPADDPIARGRMPLAGVLHMEHYDASVTSTVLEEADALMRTWAQRTNRERGGYQGRPVHEGRGWGDRMVQLWGSDSSYVLSRQALVNELQRLGFGLK